MTRPNILYISSHDTGRFIQPYGQPVETPNLQRLAEGGVLFRQAFCAGPTCSPSRAALLTGSYPHENGMLGLAHRGFALNDYSQHLCRTLRNAGYTTALAGFQHVAEDPAVIGYDRIIAPDEGDGGDLRAAAAAARFIEGEPPRPFYLEVGFHDTHREFPEVAKEDARCEAPPPYFPDTPETRYDFACFKASARRLDENVGRVLDALDRSGMAENTLVIYATDHGIAFPRMKCNLTDGGIGVAMIMRGPGGFSGGKVVDSLISHVDLFPTLCDLLEIEKPPWLSGLSFLPVVEGKAGSVRDEIFAGVTYHAAYEPQRCVRNGRWKYIRRFGDRRRVVLPNCDDCPTKTLWMENGWADMEHPQEALYDLVFDPQESDNLAADPGRAGILADMRAKLEAYMVQTSDPLLDGPVPAPAGARANDPDGISPAEKPMVL